MPKEHVIQRPVASLGSGTTDQMEYFDTERQMVVLDAEGTLPGGVSPTPINRNPTTGGDPASNPDTRPKPTQVAEPVDTVVVNRETGRKGPAEKAGEKLDVPEESTETRLPDGSLVQLPEGAERGTGAVDTMFPGPGAGAPGSPPGESTPGQVPGLDPNRVKDPAVADELPEDLDTLTKDQLKAELDKRGVEYASNDTKVVLIEKLEEALDADDVTE